MAKAPTLTVQLMNATIRISELEQQLAEAKAQFAKAESARLKLAVEAIKPANTNRKVIAPRAEWVRPAWMEAARAQAMATGSVVLA